MTRTNASLELAIYWASRGFPVFPTLNKRPLTKHGQNDATTDLAQIEAWAIAYPNCRWAIQTGPKIGYWFLDLDPPRGMEKIGRAHV